MPGLLHREIDFGPALARVRRRPAECLVALGLVARIAEYLRNRHPWMDESSLAANIRGHSFLEPPALLSQDQVAPFGFLATERLIAAVLGDSYLALRLLPFLAGLASVLLFARVARRLLGPTARLWALGLFALSDPLIYFSCELKPYVVDVAATLVVLGWPDADEIARASLARLAGIAALGAALVWFSFPVVFTLAAVGLTWIGAGLARRDGRTVLTVTTVALVWLLSFAGSYLVGRRLLGPRTGMWAFWVFAFPDRSWDGVLFWIPARLVNLFANPVQFDTPIGARASAFLGLGLAVAGGVLLGRRGGAVGRLGIPVALALVVGACRLYPFHGRLILFLVPVAYLLMAEGLAGAGRFVGPRGRIVLAAFVFFWPVVELLGPLLEERNRPFSPFGDLRIDPFRPLPEEPH